jgi:RNA polymerase sigma factor (sigma-70 family)
MDPRPAALLRHLRRLVSRPCPDPAADAELLGRFVRRRDEVAFAALVERHGPMVLRVCRRVLADPHAAEDALQAVFVVLARRAADIRPREAVAGWLHGVAYRVARKARAADSRRRRREGPSAGLAPPDPRPDPLAELTVRELLTALDEEVQRLPRSYRLPVILCCLEGHTQEEASRLLGWTPGSVKGRLERGRARLRERLARRGLSLPAALAAVGVGQGAASAGLSATLAGATVRAAAFAGGAGASAIPDRVLALAEAGMRGMAVAKAKVTLGLVLLAGALVAGAGPAVFQARTATTPAQAEGAGDAAARGAGHQKPGGEKLPRTDRHGDPLPEGAVARLGTTRFRHDHSSLHLKPAFSPDGKVLATGGSDGIHLWDPASGKLLRGIPVRYGDYGEPFFAPGGRRLIGCRWLGWEASRQAGHNAWMVRLWDPGTGRPLHDIPTDGKALACSPDGKRLVTAADDGSASLWDLATGRRTTRLRGGHKKQVTDLAFTAGGKGLVTCCSDRVCHWDLAGGRLERTVELAVPRQVHRTCLSPDGRSLAVSPRNRGPVFVLDTTTGKERVRLRGELARGGYGLAFSPDGKTLATSRVDLQKWDGATEVAFWDAGTGKLLRHFPTPARAALHLRFAPGGRTLVTAGQEPLVRLWDVATGKPVHHRPAHEGAISALAFTPDGAALVSGSSDGSVRLWDVKGGRHLRELQGHRGGVSGVAVTPDGKTVVSGGTDGCLRLQSPDGKGDRRLLPGRPPEGLDRPGHQVCGLGLSPDGKTAATYSVSSRGGVYHVWDLSTSRAVIQRRDPAKVISPRTFSPDARLVLQHVFGGGADSGPGGGGGTSAALPDSALAVVEDVASGKQVLALGLPERAGNIGTFAADGRSLLTASYQDERRGDGWHYDNALHLWELASRKVRRIITWGGRGRFIQAALAPDGRTVATAGDDRTIQIWDLATGKELLRRGGFPSRAECLAYSPDGRSLVSGHRDGTILVWDVGVVGGHRGDPEARPDRRRIRAWWSDLAGADAGKAHLAVCRLAVAPGPTVDWLREQLRPAREVPAGRLRSLIAGLGSTDFSRREAASERLASLADRAGPALRAALKADLSAEQRRRIEKALATLTDVPPANKLRDLRAVEVLERIGTPEAKQLLEKLARGAPEARLTREAKAALARPGVQGGVERPFRPGGY